MANLQSDDTVVHRRVKRMKVFIVGLSSRVDDPTFSQSGGPTVRRLLLFHGDCTWVNVTTVELGVCRGTDTKQLTGVKRVTEPAAAVK